MIRRFTIGCAVLGAILLGGAAVSAEDGRAQPAFGNWSRDDGEARVRIAPCGKSLCAINIWIRNGDGSEKVGDRLVMDLKPSGAASWSGSAYDPQRKLTYSMTMTMRGGKLQTKGCVLGGIICRNVSWTRAR